MRKKHDTSYRQQRAANLIRIALVECLMRAKQLDSRLTNTVAPLTITNITVTNDLRLAKCYFIPFNTTLDYTEILEALNISKYAIRAYITDKVLLKFSPDIRFFYDEHFEHVSNLLN